MFGGVALDGNCREGGTFAFSAIRLILAFSKLQGHKFQLNNLLNKILNKSSFNTTADTIFLPESVMCDDEKGTAFDTEKKNQADVV